MSTLNKNWHMMLFLDMIGRLSWFDWMVHQHLEAFFVLPGSDKFLQRLSGT